MENFFSDTVNSLIEGYDGLDPSSPERAVTLASIEKARQIAWGRFLRSAYARSAELIFLRTQRGEWSANPADSVAPRLLFPGETGDGVWDVTVGGIAPNVDAHDWLNITVDERDAVSLVYNQHVEAGVLRMSDWDSPTDGDGERTGVVDRSLETADPRLQFLSENDVSGAWLSFDAGEIEILPRWETMVSTPTVDEVTGEFDPSELREYMYAVIPAPDEIHGAGRFGACLWCS